MERVAVTAREVRLAEVVGAVTRRALAERGLRRVALLDDGSPEAQLAGRLLGRSLGSEAMVSVRATGQQLELVLQALGTDAADAAAEIARLRGRLLGDALVANPANKTGLLLGGSLPPDPLLPLGDLYASEVRELAGDWSVPARVLDLVRDAGGIDRLDEALRDYFDHRNPRGLETLPEGARARVAAALAKGRHSRVYGCIVPKIGPRTIGVDLLE